MSPHRLESFLRRTNRIAGQGLRDFVALTSAMLELERKVLEPQDPTREASGDALPVPYPE